MSDDPFRYLTSILETKEYQEDLSGYVPSFVNHGLSQHLDCILFVNEINKSKHKLDVRQQYDFYFYSIRQFKRKRVKWSKKADDTEVQAVAEYYQVSPKKAEEYISLLTKTELEDIVEQYKEMSNK